MGFSWYLKENILNSVYSLLKLDVRGEVWLRFLKLFRVPYYLWICCKLNAAGFECASPYFGFFIVFGFVIFFIIEVL